MILFSLQFFAGNCSCIVMAMVFLYCSLVFFWNGSCYDVPTYLCGLVDLTVVSFKR